jgi:integrase
LQFTRKSYQLGSLRKVPRKKGPPVWEFRYRESCGGARRQRQVTLTTARYRSEAQARRAVEKLLIELNRESPPVNSIIEPAFGTLIDRFIAEEHLVEIRGQHPGSATLFDGLQYSTACAYLSMLERHIRPRWGTELTSRVRPWPVQHWLLELKAAPKYKGKIKALMHRLFEKAMLWDLIELKRNPMTLVEIRGISKRRKKPFVLIIEQFFSLLDQLPEPYRTMAIVAQCTGLRVSEILALKWSDIDFEHLTMRVTRKVVNGRVSRMKTEYSEDDLPMDPDFATHLLDWKRQAPASPEDWVFSNPLTCQPYYASEIQKDYLRPAGRRVGLEVNGQSVNLGWHTFRHTYRSLLDATGAPIGVQQKLMRHAQVSTTMDVYGNALMESKREANSKVVGLLLRVPKDSPSLQQ